MEALLGRQDLICLTAQTPADAKKLQQQVLGAMELGDVGIRLVSQSLSELNPPSLSPQELEQFGLEGCALEYIDGPEPVLAMLCGSKRIQVAGISLQEITEDQHRMLTNSRCTSWVAGNSSNKVNKRSEYGSGATSTATNTVKSARWWTDAPVDTSAKREIEEKIETLTRTLAHMKGQRNPLKAQLEDAEKSISDLVKEMASSPNVFRLYTNLLIEQRQR